MNARLKTRLDIAAKQPFTAACIVFATSLIVMLIYDIAEDTFFSGLTLLQSRLLSIVFTSICTGIFAFVVSNNAAIIKSEIEENEERVALYDAAMTATMHSIGNAMNLFKLIELEAEDDGKVSKETLRIVQTELWKAQEFMKNLSLIENPTASNVKSYLDESLKTQNQ